MTEAAAEAAGALGEAQGGWGTRLSRTGRRRLDCRASRRRLEWRGAPDHRGRLGGGVSLPVRVRGEHSYPHRMTHVATRERVSRHRSLRRPRAGVSPMAGSPAQAVSLRSGGRVCALAQPSMRIAHKPLKNNTSGVPPFARRRAQYMTLHGAPRDRRKGPFARSVECSVAYPTSRHRGQQQQRDGAPRGRQASRHGYEVATYEAPLLALARIRPSGAKRVDLRGRGSARRK